MPLDQLLLFVLGLALVANVVVVALIPFWSRSQPTSARWGGPEPGEQAAGPAVIATGVVAADADDADDARTAAAIEAFVAAVATDAPGRPGPLPVADRPAALSDVEPSTTPTAGIADPPTWDRILREESARVARFGRPATVVIAELPHLDDVAERLGGDVADQLVTETARLLVKEGRAVDRIARLADARFGVLLLETDEVGAGPYIDRLRPAVDGWLESAGMSIRLSLGWASPAEGDDVVTAAATAAQRVRAVDD